MERRWLILIVSTGLIMVTLIIGLLIHQSFHRDICIDDVCQSPECVQAAAQILNYIDTEINPCDNFYAFVCGNFIKTAEISDDMNEVSTNTILNDDLQKQLKTALEEPLQLEDIKPFKLLKTFYQACSHTESIERRGLKIVRELLKDIGGWPVLEDHSWDNKNLEWYYYIYKFRQLGLNTNHILKLDVQHDLKNSTFHILELDQPSLSLPRNFLIDEVQSEYVEEYRRYMVNVAVYLGAHEFRATIELRDSLKFEMKLANISVSKEDRLNITNFYNIMSITQLQEKYPTIPWLQYINNLISPVYQVTTHERILVLVPNYVKKLEELLQKTPRRDQINYLVWKAIASIVPYLTEDLREMEFKFRSATSGIVQRLPRWKECLQETYKSFPIALSALYVRKFFDDCTKTSAEEVVQYVKEEYEGALENLDWMDEKTKESALAKAEAMTNIIGYPDELLNDNKLEEIYKAVALSNVLPLLKSERSKMHDSVGNGWNQMGVDLRSKEYLQSFLNISLMNANLKYKQLRMLKAETAWMDHSTIAEVDALYSVLANKIIIPAGILQGTYFNKNHPNYLNYGGVGFAIAHEITHAFDDTGRLFDKYGNLANWWQKETESSYLDKVQCIIDQYSNYNVSEVDEMVNSMITLDDNVADNGGIRHAYSAYIKWTEKNQKEKKLPGLPYTSNQLFWISFGINQCSKQRPEYLKLVMSTEAHSPPEFRVQGPLSNSGEFAYDFDCLSDSPMQSENVCIVW